jgi:8-oxo-dGTP pyrophosphatase MutT (NUDIX family)
MDTCERTDEWLRNEFRKVKAKKAVAVILWFGDKICLTQRLKTKTFSGFWACAGGSVDDTDESITHAAQREILEECGHQIFFTRDSLNIVDCYQEGDFKCFVFEGKMGAYRFTDIRNPEPDKHSDWTLFTPKEILKLKNVMPSIKMYIRNYLTKNQG